MVRGLIHVPCLAEQGALRSAFFLSKAPFSASFFPGTLPHPSSRKTSSLPERRLPESCLFVGLPFVGRPSDCFPFAGRLFQWSSSRAPDVRQHDDVPTQAPSSHLPTVRPLPARYPAGAIHGL